MAAKTQRKAAAKPATTKRGASATTKRGASSTRVDGARRAAARTADLSDEILQELEEGASSALEAVRKFLGTVDEAIPPHGDGPSRREEITDSALVMAQRLVHTQAEFLRKVVDSAGRTLTAPSKRQ